MADDDDWSGEHAEETKRIARLVEMANLLGQQRPGLTRAYLAAHFERSERQIARDLDVLRHSLKYQIDIPAAAI